MQRILRQLKCIYSIYSNSHQFAYRDNRSTEDAKATEPHNPDPFLIGFSSEFSTIISNRLATKLGLSLPHSICLWILEQPPRVSQGPHLSQALSLKTCSPQGCVLHTRLHPNTVQALKLAGLMTRGDESVYKGWKNGHPGTAMTTVNTA